MIPPSLGRKILPFAAIFLLFPFWFGCSGGPGERTTRRSPRVSVEVERPVRGEMERLMLMLESKNWHRRFVAALELRKRGVNAGLSAVRAGLRAKEWFVRADALRYAAECRFVQLVPDVAALLDDPVPEVAQAADAVLAALLRAYPRPLESNRKSAWRFYLASASRGGEVETLRAALVRVRKGLKSDEPGEKVEALMILGGLRIEGRTRMCLPLLSDPDDRVSLHALRLLSRLCPGPENNAAVEPLLERKNPVLGAEAALYLAERGEGEKVKWRLVDALLVPGCAARAHALLLETCGGGPFLRKPVSEYEPQELASAWRKFIIADEILKRKRDWEAEPQPSLSPAPPAPAPRPRPR